MEYAEYLSEFDRAASKYISDSNSWTSADKAVCGVHDLYRVPNDPVVIALANELGAFHVSDREFAERAFAFFKDKLVLNETPINDVAGTFRRGTGTCFHLIPAFIALCRCAGIKARHKVFAMKMMPSW
ncbi:MAG: transglutaminase family protein, partial [Euryarchaeota archaeon]|nr:transglutaminase family protein [Euryarchaeota archaeon]